MKVLINNSPLGTVTAKFGEVSEIHTQPHKGIDIACKIGEEIHAPMDGIVERVVDYGSHNIGKGVFVKTESGYTYLLGHLSKSKVKVQQVVEQGDLLGLCGDSGRSFGSHLHFGVYDYSHNFIDPVKWYSSITAAIGRVGDKATEAYVKFEHVSGQTIDLFNAVGIETITV